MNVTIHGVHFSVTPGLRRFVQDNLVEPLEAAWPRHSESVSLDVYLTDLRGPKGGLDRECRCVLHPPGGPQIVITEVTEDMRSSIHNARKRLLRRTRQHRELRMGAGRRLRQASRLSPLRFDESAPLL